MNEQTKKDYSVLPSLKGVRVLFLGTYPPPFGGIAAHLKTLRPALIKAGIDDIAVLSFGAKNSVETEDGVTVYRFNLRSNLWQIFLPQYVYLMLKVSYRLGVQGGLDFKLLVIEILKSIITAKLVSKHKSNVVSSYMAHESLQLLPLNEHWRRKKGIVLTVFGEVYEAAQFMEEHKSLMNQLLLIPDFVLASSNHCANSFRRIGNKRPIKVVVYGVELESVTSQVGRDGFRKKHGIKQDEVLVFFMGRMVKNMGLDVVLDTAEALLGSEPKARILIAGATGDLSPQAHALAKQYPDRVLAFENISLQLQREFYSATDILVAPSFNQRACMGVSIKEAMAARLPVVGGAGGGVPEAVVDGETGFLVPVGVSGSVDGEKYLEVVRKLVSSPELRARFGYAGRQRAEELFSVEDTNARIAEIIQAAANTRK